MIKSSFTFISLMIFGTAALARPEITIPAKVEISQREKLTLIDIADVTEGSDELLAMLEKIVIREDARELLLSQKLKIAEVLSSIRAQTAGNATWKTANPGLKIPSEIHVDFAATPISKQEVERKVTNVLRTRCHDCDYKVNIQSTPYPSGKTWTLDYSQMASKGGFLVPVRDGDERNLKWVSGNIRVAKLTPVANRLISQGERLQASDLRMEMLDVSFAKDASVKVDDLQGKIAARSIPVGTPVWASDLKREPAALRGQMIKGILGDETFEITVSVQAEDSGFVGDVIKVKNLDTQKTVSGVVLEKGLVKIQ
jgi:flagella basal body P-ring formation protein FlgA